MLSYEVTIDAPPPAVWSLVAEPRRWREWAPHVRSPRGLGDPEVEEGRRGSVRIGGAVPVAATIIAVDPGRAWAWRVGRLRLDHAVEARDDGALAAVRIHAAPPAELALRVTYGPAVWALLRNLARVAEAGQERR